MYIGLGKINFNRNSINANRGVQRLGKSPLYRNHRNCVRYSVQKHNKHRFVVSDKSELILHVNFSPFARRGRCMMLPISLLKR